MKIKTIAYGVTHNTGNYENIKLYAEAEVEDWENPEETLNHLRNWVKGQVNQHREVDDLREKKNRIERQLDEYNWKLAIAAEKWKSLTEKWDEAVAFLRHHGLESGYNLPKAPQFVKYEDFKNEDVSDYEDEDEDEDEDDDL